MVTVRRSVNLIKTSSRDQLSIGHLMLNKYCPGFMIIRRRRAIIIHTIYMAILEILFSQEAR